MSFGVEGLKVDRLAHGGLEVHAAVRFHGHGPQHGACVVKGTKKMEAFGEKKEYLILETVISEMVLKVPVDMAEEVGVRPPVSADELEDLVAVLAKPDPRVPSNWSRRFKNHQEKLKSGDVYQVAEVVRNRTRPRW